MNRLDVLFVLVFLVAFIAIVIVIVSAVGVMQNVNPDRERAVRWLGPLALLVPGTLSVSGRRHARRLAVFACIALLALIGCVLISGERRTEVETKGAQKQVAKAMGSGLARMGSG